MAGSTATLNRYDRRGGRISRNTVRNLQSFRRTSPALPLLVSRNNGKGRQRIRPLVRVPS